MVKKNILGIDVGTNSVKAMVGTFDEGRVTVKGIGTAVSQGFVRGVVVDPTELADSVKTAMDSAIRASGKPADAVYLGLSGLDIGSMNSIGSVTPASVKRVTGEDMQRACQAATLAIMPENQRILHIIPAGYWMDGVKTTNPLDCKAARLDAEAHIVSVPNSAVDELLEALESRRVRPDGLTANCVMGAEALHRKIGGDCLIVDMGAGITDLALYSEGVLRMSASIPLGGEYITGDVMQGLEIGREHAEAIKRYYSRLEEGLLGRDVTLDCNDYGTTGKQVSYDFLYKIVESRVEEIATILHGYLEPVLGCYGVRKLILTGGCAALPSTARWLESVFGLEVHIARLEGELPAELALPENTACYGLLQYAFRMEVSGAAEQKPRRSFLSRIRDFI